MATASLQKFYDITLNDPLFAAEGLDIKNALDALSALKDVTKKLEIVDSSPPGKFRFLINPLTNILHPFDFLNNFMESETARRHFLANPSYSTAKNLISINVKTQKALKKNLHNYRRACLAAQNKATTKNPNARSYNFYCRKLSFSEFISTIDLMIKNTSALSSELDLRSKLLLKSIRSEFTNPEKIIKGVNKRNKPVGTLKILNMKSKLPKSSKNMVQMAAGGRDFVYYLEQDYGKISTKLTGPIFYELSQFDIKPKIHEFYVSISYDKKGLGKHFYPILADNFHFVDLRKDRYNFYADISTYEPLTKRGIIFWYQPASSFYFTSDASYYADLATLVDLKQRSNLNQDLVLNQKSSLLDLLLWTGYYHNLGFLHNVSARIKTGKKSNSWHYIIVGRSYASLYYLSFNSSVWRLKEKPNFLGKPTPSPDFYLDFEDLPKSLTRKGLNKIFDGGKIRAIDLQKMSYDS